MRLALIDGTNAVMRRAMVQTDLSKERIVAGTVLNILDFVREVQATHLIVAFDSKSSWRRDMLPEYKADRTIDTGPWAAALLNACAQRGIAAVGCKDYEADDVIATLTKRAKARAEVVTLSSDNDLLTLVEAGVRCFQYKKGGGFVELTEADVEAKLPVTRRQMPIYHALVGGKNGAPGVPGYGKKKATALITGPSEAWLKLPDAGLTRWVCVLALNELAPVVEIIPAYCRVDKIRAGVPLGE
jgi:DNA polymerase-1